MQCQPDNTTVIFTPQQLSSKSITILTGVTCFDNYWSGKMDVMPWSQRHVSSLLPHRQAEEHIVQWCYCSVGHTSPRITAANKGWTKCNQPLRVLHFCRTIVSATRWFLMAFTACSLHRVWDLGYKLYFNLFHWIIYLKKRRQNVQMKESSSGVM